MAEISRPIMPWSTLARHKDSPRQQSQFPMLYVVFFNSHIDHGQYETYKYLDKCINTHHHTLHGAVDLTISLFYWIVKVRVLPFLVFAVVVNHRLPSYLYYNVVISLQFNSIYKHLLIAAPLQVLVQGARNAQLIKIDPDNSPSLTSMRLVPILALFMSSEHSEAPKERGRGEPESMSLGCSLWPWHCSLSARWAREDT